jgi:hypothetical protein
LLCSPGCPGIHLVFQARFTLAVLWSQFPKCWDPRHGLGLSLRLVF